jgi:hypothetical protein
MSIKNIMIVQAVLLVFCSCQMSGGTTAAIDFDITSPKPGWVYNEDAKIILALNIDTHDIVWRSSLEGDLGRGNHLLRFLSPGLHVISAEVLGAVKTSWITVARTGDVRKESKMLLNYSPIEKKLAEGNNYSYIITHDGSVEGFSAENIEPAGSRQIVPRSLGAGEGLVRDIRLESPRFSGSMLIRGKKNGARTLTTAAYTAGERRIFFITNTVSPYSEAHKLEAKLYYFSDAITV